MHWVTIIWSMTASASLTLGMLHVMVWSRNREKLDRLAFSFMAFATAWLTFCELTAHTAVTPEAYGMAVRWAHVPVTVLSFAVTAFIFTHMRAGRLWLAVLSLGLRVLALVINFIVEPNINYREITGLKHVSFLGDQIVVPISQPNPLMLIGQIALVLRLIFVVDASFTVWRRGNKRQALLVGGGMILFILMGMIQSMLSLWNGADVPAGWSIYFLGVIIVVAFDLSLETRRAARLAVELKETQDSKHMEVTHLGRVASFGRLSGAIAHEINQPLGSILSNAQAAQQILKKKAPDLQELREIMGDIVSDDLRASEVINRIRTLMRRGVVNRQRLDLNEVIADVVKLTRSTLKERQVMLTQDLTQDLPDVYADRVQLQQVLLNLILNACEAMEGATSDRRQLSLSTYNDGKRVNVAVSDLGRGLPEDTEGIFLPFFTTKDQGLGMGLAICRSIITTHQGQLNAEPNEPCGATFRISLPAANMVP